MRRWSNRAEPVLGARGGYGQRPGPRFTGGLAAVLIGLLTVAGVGAATVEDALPGLPGDGGRGRPPAARPPPLRFFAVGDLPYSESEVAPLRALLADAAAQHPPFIVHLGDIKSGGSPCSDGQLLAIAALFRAVPVPVVYTPGDNEWTDCHRLSAGLQDPRARLRRVRELFFGDPTVLRLGALGVSRAGVRFPEIVGFVVEGVLFVALHLVGSDNGRNPRDPEAMAEFAAREVANQSLLTRMLTAAPGRAARALVVMMQADPFFDQTPGPLGFRGLKDRLVALMGQFPGPVLVLHGDTHWFRHDHPVLDPRRGVPFARLTRVEVPGSPVVGGVWITVDPQAPEPFGAEPVYAVSLDAQN